MLPNQKRALGIIRKYHPEVNLVVDATKPLTIKVTKADADSGKSKVPDKCALARACERTYDGAIISLSRAYLIKGKTAIRYDVSNHIARELVSFDRHNDFAPGEYRFGKISENDKLGSHHVPPKKRSKVTTKFKPRLHRTTGIRSL